MGGWEGGWVEEETTYRPLEARTQLLLPPPPRTAGERVERKEEEEEEEEGGEGEGREDEGFPSPLYM